MSHYLEPQLKNAEEIRAVLKEIPITFQLADGRDVKTLLVYLPADNGKTCNLEFFEKVKDGILSNFVFSCTEVEKKLGIKNQKSAEKLFNKAIRKLSKHTAKGELGELILFTLLDVYFKAPKLLSKVSFKTNPRMPVFGADAVHGQFHDGKFRLYLGESKLYKKFKPAAKEAAESIKSAKDKYEDEFDLLDSHMDFPNIDEDLETELLGLLNPFSNTDLSDVIHSPCFIGFTDSELISSSATEEVFLEKYKALAGEHIASFFDKVENEDVAIGEASLLMLPFSCVDVLVNEFIAYMGIEN